MATLTDLLTSKIAPHSLEAERAVLGCILLEHAGLALATERLAASDFYKDGHRRIYDAMCAVAGAGGVVDLLTVSEALKTADALDAIGGPAYLAQLCDEGTTLTQMQSYLAIVRDKAGLRELIRLGTDLVGRAYENGRGAAELVALTQVQIEAAARYALPSGRAQIPVTLAQLAAAPPTEPSWLVDGILLQQANGWCGAGAKVGKSYLLLDLLLACALGEAWLGQFAIARPLVVVLVEEEDSAWRVYQRAMRLCAGRGVAMPERFYVHVRSGLQLDAPATLEPFLRWLVSVRADLVVWDVFNRLHTLDERRPDQMLPLLKRIDQVRDELGCANLIAHHARKPTASGPDLASGGQKLRGPSEFWAWAENSLYLSPLKGKGVLLVEPESKDAITEPFRAHLEDMPDGGRRWVYDGVVQAKIAEGAKTRQSITDALATGPMTAAALADHVGKSERAVKSHLAALEKDGVLDSIKEPGRYGRRTWMLRPEAQTSDDIPF